MQDQDIVFAKNMELDLKAQNPRQMLEILFSLSQHISAEEPIEKHVYKTEINRKLVHAFAKTQNAQQMIKI